MCCSIGQKGRFCVFWTPSPKGRSPKNIFVVNVNDNLPVFKSNEAVWRFPSNARRYMVIGKAIATDADGDDITYEFRGGKKVAGSGCCIIVPKTGEIMLVETPFVPTHIAVVARYYMIYFFSINPSHGINKW